MPLIRNLKRFFGVEAGHPQPGLPATEAAPAPAGLPTTTRQREVLYRFIVEKLAAYAAETEGLPLGLRLWVRCADKAEEDRMAVALYANEPGLFQAELSRHLANQYVRFAPDWLFSWQFVSTALPASCTYQQDNLGLEVIHPTANEPLRARLRTLTGQTTKESYLLDPAVQTDYHIGRGQTVQTASGRVRINDIAFVDGDEPGFDPQRGEPNLSVSRQHATLRYDAVGRRYRLLADAGGLPANGNKTKILRVNDTIERADLPGVGYVLFPGDQIELGGEAKLILELYV